MQNKAIKITLGVIAGVLSLSTTAFAGFKVMKSNEGKVLSATSSPTATPEIIEEIEEIEEVTVINTNTAIPTTSATSLPTVFGTSASSPRSSSSSSAKPFKFDDDDDDEVEFEDEDSEDDEKDDHESEDNN
jgi:hypothetical protein